jgi:putative addiction module component (TIGR02574 family)
MSRAAGDLLNEALKLPTDARAAPADSFLNSLDEQVDEDAEQAWRQEIQQRLQEIDSGAVDLVPWPDGQRRLQSRLHR